MRSVGIVFSLANRHCDQTGSKLISTCFDHDNIADGIQCLKHSSSQLSLFLGFLIEAIPACTFVVSSITMTQSKLIRFRASLLSCVLKYHIYMRIVSAIALKQFLIQPCLGLFILHSVSFAHRKPFSTLYTLGDLASYNTHWSA